MDIADFVCKDKCIVVGVASMRMGSKYFNTLYDIYIARRVSSSNNLLLSANH